MQTPTSLTVGRTSRGYCVRVAGRGTMRESPALRAFALQVLTATRDIAAATADYTPKFPSPE